MRCLNIHRLEEHIHVSYLPSALPPAFEEELPSAIHIITPKEPDNEAEKELMLKQYKGENGCRTIVRINTFPSTSEASTLALLVNDAEVYGLRAVDVYEEDGWLRVEGDEGTMSVYNGAQGDVDVDGAVELFGLSNYKLYAKLARTHDKYRRINKEDIPSLLKRTRTMDDVLMLVATPANSMPRLSRFGLKYKKVDVNNEYVHAVYLEIDVGKLASNFYLLEADVLLTVTDGKKLCFFPGLRKREDYELFNYFCLEAKG